MRTEIEFFGIEDRADKTEKKTKIYYFPTVGYPFDRNARAGVNNLQQFLTPNMRTAEVTVVFNDRVTPRN